MLTKRHKSFGTKKKTSVEESDLSFDLGEQTYKCYAEVQGAVILDFVAAADEGGSAAAARIIPFFDHALPPEELVRFREQLKSPDEIIEMETLSEVVGYLIGEYTSRPTQASGSSDAGS